MRSGPRSDTGGADPNGSGPERTLEWPEVPVKTLARASLDDTIATFVRLTDTYLYATCQHTCDVTMSMGAYDEEEHERREAQASKVDADFDDERTVYHGEVEYDSGDSAEELLETFQQIKDQ